MRRWLEGWTRDFMHAARALAAGRILASGEHSFRGPFLGFARNQLPSFRGTPTSLLLAYQHSLMREDRRSTKPSISIVGLSS